MSCNSWQTGREFFWQFFPLRLFASLRSPFRFFFSCFLSGWCSLCGPLSRLLLCFYCRCGPLRRSLFCFFFCVFRGWSSICCSFCRFFFPFFRGGKFLCCSSLRSLFCLFRGCCCLRCCFARFLCGLLCLPRTCIKGCGLYCWAKANNLVHPGCWKSVAHLSYPHLALLVLLPFLGLLPLLDLPSTLPNLYQSRFRITLSRSCIKGTMQRL